jgi:hypothetical protein
LRHARRDQTLTQKLRLFTLFETTESERKLTAIKRQQPRRG